MNGNGGNKALNATMAGGDKGYSGMANYREAVTEREQAEREAVQRYERKHEQDTQ